MRKLFNEFKSWKEDDARRTEYLAIVIGAAFMLLILLIIRALDNAFDIQLLTAISAILLGKLGAAGARLTLFLLCRRSK